MYKYAFKKPLIELAKLMKEAGYTLYAVGGMVRNPLLDLPISDMDVCSAMPPDALISLCKKHRITYVEKGIRFGMLELHLKSGGERVFVEHTTFRSDTYNKTGAHKPESVTFSNNLDVDAHRRDFTVNALYRDILTGEIIDPTGGLYDLEHRILRTTSSDPEVILRDDGLRIMRLARFASELMFEIEQNTLNAAVKNVELLLDISGERIRDELVKLLLCDIKYPSIPLADTKYPWSGKVFYGLNLMHQIGIFKTVLPEVAACDGVLQNEAYHAFDVLGHTLRVCACIRPSLHMRLAGLFHDVGKPVNLDLDKTMHRHAEYSAPMTKKALTRLRFSNEIIEKTVTIVREHSYDVGNHAKDSTLRKHFALMGHELSLELCDMREADLLGKGVSRREGDICGRWRRIIDDMQREGAPMSYQELNCSGSDIANWLKIPPGPKIGEIKRKLLLHCAVFPGDNTKERLFSIAKKLNS